MKMVAYNPLMLAPNPRRRRRPRKNPAYTFAGAATTYGQNLGGNAAGYVLASGVNLLLMPFAINMARKMAEEGKSIGQVVNRAELLGGAANFALFAAITAWGGMTTAPQTSVSSAAGTVGYGLWQLAWGRVVGRTAAMEPYVGAMKKVGLDLSALGEDIEAPLVIGEMTEGAAPAARAILDPYGLALLGGSRR